MGKHFPEAQIALCRCGKHNKVYGVRFEKYKDGWKPTWAFPIKESTAAHEGYDATILKGQIYPDDHYPGCPYCHSEYFFVCDDCGGKLTCYDGQERDWFSCSWCGWEGPVSAYDGSGISSGGDR